MKRILLGLSLLVLTACPDPGPALPPPPAVVREEVQKEPPESGAPLPTPPERKPPPPPRSGPGTLDPAFGDGGVITSNPTISRDPEEATCLTLDSDILYVGGTDFRPGNGQWRIEKHRVQDGSLFKEFSDHGAIASNPSDGNDSPAGMAVRGKFIFVVGNDGGGLAMPVPCGHEGSIKNPSWRVERRHVTDGSMDRDFGVLGGWTGVVEGMAICKDFVSDDASLYFLATYVPRETDRFRLAKDGTERLVSREWRIDKRQSESADPAHGFGKRGTVRSTYGPGPNGPAAIIIHDGHLYIAGTEATEASVLVEDGERIRKSGTVRWRLERRDRLTGEMDHGFPIHIGPTSGPDRLTDMATDGKFLFIVGCIADHSIRIEKRTLGDASLVEGFGASGVLTEDSIGRAYGLAVQGTHLYVAAFETSPGWIQRRLPDTGALDASFGDSGTERGEGGTHYRGMAIDSTHIYLVGGEKVGTSDTRWRIEKRFR